MKVSNAGVYIKFSDDSDNNVALLRKSNINAVSYTLVKNIPKSGVAPISNTTPKATVHIEQVGGRITNIPLGNDGTTLNVSNQAGWTNNEAGALAAVADIQSWA